MLTTAKNRSGGGSVTVVRAEADGGIRRPRSDGCWGLRCVSEGEIGAGSERGTRGRGSALLNRGRGAGDAPTMREERARLRLDRRCRLRVAREEGGGKS